MIMSHSLGDCEYAGRLCPVCESIVRHERQRLGQKARREGSAAQDSPGDGRGPETGL